MLGHFTMHAFTRASGTLHPVEGGGALPSNKFVRTSSRSDQFKLHFSPTILHKQQAITEFNILKPVGFSSLKGAWFLFWFVVQSWIQTPFRDSWRWWYCRIVIAYITHLFCSVLPWFMVSLIQSFIIFINLVKSKSATCGPSSGPLK